MCAALTAANINLGNLEEAALWGRRAQAVPHSDLMVMVGAMCANYLVDRIDDAKAIAARIRAYHPTMTADGIHRANPMMQPEQVANMRRIFTAMDFD